MQRRQFLQHGTQAALASALLPLAASATPSLPASAADTSLLSAAPAAPFALSELTITDLQAQLASGKATSRSLCQQYLSQIAAIDKAGPRLNSVIELNPDALSIADGLDKERKAGKLRGPMHGIPVLIKDNIDTGDKMQTTAGALALAGHHAAQDSHVAKQLRAAGAIILGKTNLSEWANFRSTHSASGWSSRGGQTHNPYVLDRTPSGSSAGSGSAASASLCAAAVGTETNGSIVSPSSVNGLVGLKPTVGLVSRTGIIPISATQDTAGPMARCVRDAAILLGALAGPDPADAVTVSANNPAKAADYTRLLRPDALKGQKLGVEKSHLASQTIGGELLRKAVADLKAQGATVVEVDVRTATQPIGESEFDVLLYEFKDGVNKYLAGTKAPVKTLADVIAFNKANAAKAMPFFQQEILEQAEKTDGLASEKYKSALRKVVDTSRAALDAALKTDGGLAGIVGITTGPAACIDLINGEYGTGPGSASAAAMAGYPHLTLPMGYVHELPIGLSFVGAPYKEAELLGLGYAYEQATKHRKAPGFKPVIG
ncbi:amidase [Hymenobacter ginsengisoli]|uniref:Amidase n=1 Tax=Hymenobacter ginsengisoli TaxID=1051626 RepID=A0ABP8QPM9_9BACT|nr:MULTISPECIES: amidase [unclassified Hymenobacter]MBO2032886.1 amidase [Hymenobacter sp. BT559]